MAYRDRMKLAMPYGVVVKDIRHWKKGYRYQVSAPKGWTTKYKGGVIMTDLPSWGTIIEWRTMMALRRKT